VKRAVETDAAQRRLGNRSAIPTVSTALLLPITGWSRNRVPEGGGQFYWRNRVRNWWRLTGPSGWRSAGSVEGGPHFLTDSSGIWTVAVTGPRGSSEFERQDLVERLVECLNAFERRR
jgi:hypothetical protein